MVALFAKAGAALVGGSVISRVPFIGGGGGGGEMPDQALLRTGVVVDRQRLTAYDRVCRFGLSDALPPTYPHMVAFPMHLALMTSGRFPVPAIGLVHIANRITVHRPIQAAEPLSLRVWATPLRPHPRGRQFDIRTEARVGDELVWEEVSTNLSRGRGTDGAPGTEAPPSTAGLPVAATWKLRGDLGRRYGAVSGDLNPIHVHPLSARLFGFPGAIAHGMWTKARCLAALGRELPASAYTVDVAFKKPILLPASVHFAEAAATGGGIAFGVRGAEHDTLHLDGLVSPVAAQTRTPSRARRPA